MPEVSAAPRDDAPVSPLRWLALGALLVGALLPASAGVDAFPYWDLDPSRNWTPTTGIQPALTVALAALSMIGAALALLAEARDGRRTPVVELALASLGSLGILAHALLAPQLHQGAHDGLEHAARSAHWLALVWSAVGIAPLARDPRLRTIVLALLATFAVPLLVKGLLQVLVEHPATMAAFERTKLAVFESKGWRPGSPASLAYERRLTQSDASGWFGLSNVYASFTAATLAGLLAAATATLARARRVTPPLLVALGVAAAAGIGLVLSNSKGGVGAAALAIGATVLVATVTRVRPGWQPRLARLVGPGAILAVLGAIAVRGVLWTDLGERSLLFRAFYAIGSLRIWGDHPIAGVGPDGFQDAYASAKVPIATETVQSPHSVLFDWTATLGVFGLAWAVWLVWRSTRLFAITPAVPEPAGADAPKPDRDTLRWTAVVVAACSLGGAFIERGLATPEFAVARVVSLAGWLAAAVLLLRFMRTNAGAWFAAVSGLTLVAHAQIEVTPVWPNAAPLFGLWLGVATAGHQTARRSAANDDASERTSRRSALPLFGASIPAVLATWMLASPAVVLSGWQGALRDAAEIVRPAAEFREAFADAVASQDRAALERVAGRVSSAIGGAVPARPGALDHAIEALRLGSLDAATPRLADATALRPGHIRTRSSSERVVLELATTTNSVERRRELASALQEIPGESSPIRPRSIALWDWRGVRNEQLAGIDGGLGNDTEFGDQWFRDLFNAEALRAWKATAERAPYALRPAIRLMDLNARLGDADAARDWAAIALRLDANTALDPIAGLTDAERSRAEALLTD